MRRRKRSINNHLLHKKRPSHYWLNVAESFGILVVMLAWLLRLLATGSHVVWRLDEVTVVNTIGSIGATMLCREFVNYWAHRLLHSHLLYNLVHEGHHAIPCCHGLCDGLNMGVLDAIQVIFVVLLPLLFVPMHVLTAVVYLVVIGFFGFVLNHCGREIRLTLPMPYLRPLVLFDNQHHDDHHVYRRGNYADFLPILDDIFGTAIVVKDRKPLPAQKLWKNVAKRMHSWLEATRHTRGDAQPDRLDMSPSKRILRQLSRMLSEHEDCTPDPDLGAKSN